jgi:hypothetical protein
MVEAFAKGAIPNLIVIRDAINELLRRQSGRIAPTLLSGDTLLLSAEQPAVRERLRQLATVALKVSVVTLALAGHQDAHDMMEVVCPHAVESPAASVSRPEHHRFVPFVLGDDESAGGLHRFGDFREDVPG